MQCLGVIDGVSEHDEDEFGLYGFGSEPMTDSDKAIPLETLLARLDTLSEQIAAALEKMPESRLDERWMRSTASWLNGCISILSTTKPITWVSSSRCTNWRWRTVPVSDQPPSVGTRQGSTARELQAAQGRHDR